MKNSRGKKAISKKPGLPQVFHALGDPVRLAIVRQISQRGEIPCGGFAIDMPKSTLSHHFRVLRTARVLGTRPVGTALMNYLLTDELNQRFPGLLESILNNADR